MLHTSGMQALRQTFLGSSTCVDISKWSYPKHKWQLHPSTCSRDRSRSHLDSPSLILHRCIIHESYQVSLQTCWGPIRSPCKHAGKVHHFPPLLSPNPNHHLSAGYNEPPCICWLTLSQHSSVILSVRSPHLSQNKRPMWMFICLHTGRKHTKGIVFTA